MALRHPEFTEALERMVEWADSQETPLLKGDAAGTAVKDLREAMFALAKIRVSAMRELSAAGWTYADLAKEFGISKQRVDQLVNG